MASLPAKGRRARILRAAREGATLSEVCRRVAPLDFASKRDASFHRLKTTAAIRRLKDDGLLAKSPWGWTPTAAGVAEIARLDRAR